MRNYLLWRRAEESGQVSKCVGVVLVPLQIVSGDQVLNALLDGLKVGLHDWTPLKESSEGK